MTSACRSVSSSADLGGRCQLDGADFAGVADDGDESLFAGGLAVLLGGFDDFDVEQSAGDGCAGRVDLHARAADGVVEVDGGGVFAEAEGQGLELLLERRGGVVASAGDAPAVRGRWR